ncbi:MAG: autotransporter domain-containing protein [Chlamydiales bacterium]|nr:autotransporter domain-containing protein [Chlamydiales bacterium]
MKLIQIVAVGVLSTCLPLSSAVYSVTSAADSGVGSLRAAITAVNGSPGASDSINITLPASSTITLLSDLPAIATFGSLTIDGVGAPSLLLSANGFQPFSISTGILTVKNFSLDLSGTPPAPATTGILNIDSSVNYVVSSSQQLGPTQGTGPIALGANMLTLDTGTATGLEYEGIISGTGASLTKMGTGGSQTLKGTNTYTGDTMIKEGTLGIVSNDNLGTSGTLMLGTGLADTPTLQSQSTLTLSRPVELNATSSMIETVAGTTLTHDSGGATGAGQLVKMGEGTLVIKTPYSHTGTTAVMEGTLSLKGNNAQLPPTDAVTLAASTMLDVSNSKPQVIGPLSGSGGLELGSNSLTVDTGAASVSYDGDANGTGGSLIKAGTGDLTLTGTNLYTGKTKIQAGTLIASSDSNLGDPAPLAIGVSPSDTPTFQMGASFAMNRQIEVNSTASTLDTQAFTLTHETLGTTGTGKLVKTGAGTVVVESPYLHTGGTEVSAGMVQLSGSNAEIIGDVALNAAGTNLDISTTTKAQVIGKLSGSGNLSLGANSLEVVVPEAQATTYSGVASGATGSMIKGGTGSLTLSGVNTYGTSTTIKDGSLIVAADNNLGAAAKPIIFEKPLPSATEGADDDMAEATPTPSTQPMLVVASSFSTTRPMQLEATNSTIDTQANTLTHQTNGTTGTGGLVKKGAGDLIVESNYAHTGGTEIDEGMVILNGASSKIIGAMNVKAPATFDMSAATTTQTLTKLEGAGSVEMGANQLVIQDNTSDAVFSGSIGGTAQLTKTGSKMLTLSGVNTYTGDTALQKGILLVPSSGVLASDVSVASGATLKGAGQVASVTSTGVVHPGASIATMTIVGNYSESGVLEIEANDTGDSSRLDVTGNVTLSSGSTLRLLPQDGDYLDGQVYTVVTFAGIRTGQFTNVTTTLPNRFTGTALYNAGNIQFVLGVVPFSNIVTGRNAQAAGACAEYLGMEASGDGTAVVALLNNLSNDLPALSDALNQMQPSQYGALALAQENSTLLVRYTLTHHMNQFYPYECNQGWPDQYQGSFWVAPVGKYADQDAEQSNYGYRTETGGVVAGGDYAIANNTRVGVAAAYTYTGLDWTSDAGNADINSVYGSLYGTWYGGGFFTDLSFIGAYNTYDAERHIDFSTIDRIADSYHGGYNIAAALGLGYYANLGAFRVEPYARADYIFLSQGSFKETNAQSLNLNVDPNSSQFIRTDVGVRLAHCFSLEKAVVVPELKLSWVRDQQLDDAEFKAGFRGSSCRFEVNGLHPINNLFAPGVGVVVSSHSGQMNFAMHYDAEVGSKFWENRGEVSFGFNY